MTLNPGDSLDRGDEAAAEQNQVAVRAVQAMIQDSVKSAVDGATQAILTVVEEKLVAQPSSTPTSTATGMLHAAGGGGGGVGINLPSMGQLPPVSAMTGIPVLPSGPTPSMGTVLSGVATPTPPPVTPQPTPGSGLLTPATPLVNLLPPPTPIQSTEAIMVGPHSPPVPKKLGTKIWDEEFVELSELLPSHLGAPEPT